MVSSELPYLQHAAEGVRRLEPYTPGMPIEELQRRLGVRDVIKLASNENPLGASPRARAALARAVGESAAELAHATRTEADFASNAASPNSTTSAPEPRHPGQRLQ